MDDKLQKALEFSNYRISLFNIKENVKIKTDTLLTHSINGGIFKSSPTLITFVKLLIDSGKTSAILTDNNINPIKIDNLQEFYDEIFSKYFEANDFYHNEYENLKKSRSVKQQYAEIFEDDK
jgi:hypothetical protein